MSPSQPSLEQPPAAEAGATALRGFRILDLGHRRAGPYAAKLLADYGAEVIKIEPPRGDAQRRLGPFPSDVPTRKVPGEFLSLNTNRRNVTCNLKSKAGRRLFLDLVRSADALIENYRPCVLPNLGLSPAALWQTNPRLIITSITNFGQTGPSRNDPTSELGVLMSGGNRQDMGISPLRPIRYAHGTISYLAGATAAGVTLAALNQHNRSGTHIDISIQEILLGVPSRFWLLEQFQAPADQVFLPLQRGEARRAFTYYQCADGHVCISPGLGLPGLLAMLTEGEADPTPPAFQTPDELDAHVAAWAITRDRRQIVEIGQRHHVMVAPVNTIADLIDEPAYVERNFFRQVKARNTNTIATVPGPPAKLLGDSPPQYRVTTTLGGENAEIWGGLTNRTRLPALRRAGIV